MTLSTYFINFDSLKDQLRETYGSCYIDDLMLIHLRYHSNKYYDIYFFKSYVLHEGCTTRYIVIIQAQGFWGNNLVHKW